MNPRAAINDLHPFQGCPFGQLGYFSKMLEHSNIIKLLSETAIMIITEAVSKCKPFVKFLSLLIFPVPRGPPAS